MFLICVILVNFGFWPFFLLSRNLIENFRNKISAVFRNLPKLLWNSWKKLHFHVIYIIYITYIIYVMPYISYAMLFKFILYSKTVLRKETMKCLLAHKFQDFYLWEVSEDLDSEFLFMMHLVRCLYICLFAACTLSFWRITPESKSLWYGKSLFESLEHLDR